MKQFLPLLAILFLFSCNKNNDPVVITDPVATGPLLKSTTLFIQNQSGEFRPAEKTEYFYTPKGVLTKVDQSQYDTQEKSFSLFSSSNFNYDQRRLSTIEATFISSAKKVVTNYEYTNDKVSRIVLHDDSEVDAKITYLTGNRIQVVYISGNGISFTYRFTTTNNNKEFEQTFVDGDQLASEVTHQFDDKKNPFSLLGYTDLYFTNVSSNNALKTSSEFFAGAIPQSVPVSYDYVYNDVNYPTQQITTYKSLGAGGATKQMKMVFEYW